MSSLTIRILTVVIPLLLLAGSFTVSQIAKSCHAKRTIKRMTSGALKGLSHGPQLRG